MKPFILALIMAGVLAAVIGIVVLAVSRPTPGNSPSSGSRVSPNLGALVQPHPRRGASGYT